MAELPASGYLADLARNEGEMRIAFEDQRDFIEQQVGGNAEGNYVITTGVVTPLQTGAFTVDTQGAASTDDLDRIEVTNFPDGSLILTRQLDNGRDVTFKHLSGGSGQLQLIGSVDFLLETNDVRMWFILSGTTWVEVGRFFGTNNAAFQSFRGFGSAAVEDVGTDPTEIPLVSSLLGLETVALPANAWFPSLTNGAVNSQLELGPSDYRVLEFVHTTDTEAHFTLTSPPKSYNGGSWTFEPIWTADDATTNSARWGMSIKRIGDGDPLAGVFGAEVLVLDAHNGTAFDTNIGTQSAAVTPGGSAAADGKPLHFMMRRVTGGGDNLAATAFFLGARLKFTRNLLTDD